MNHLENYFQNEYNLDFLELQDVNNMLENVLPGFTKAFGEDGSWPYNVNDKEKTQTKDPDSNYSFSTNSMILNMMLMACEKAKRGTLFPKLEAEDIISSILPNGYNKWIKTIRIGLLNYTTELLKKTDKGYILTYSNTYGRDDPLSIFWCNELIRIITSPSSNDNALDDDEDKNTSIRSNKIEETQLTKIKSKIDGIARSLRIKSKEICRELSPETGTPNSILNFGENQDTYQQNIHSFLILRLLYLELEMYENDPEHLEYKSSFFKFFERKLHLQLSYNDIPDSRFDPAELVFSLEGALLSGGDNSISTQTIERSFHVIEKYQDETPYWRPVNPLYSTKQGQILLPLSVEVANSLLRICVNRDNIIRKESPFSKHSGLFKRYFQWLKARMRQITSTGVSGDIYFGWESEHVGSENKIDLFQTSEISCFLINYRHMLQDRIARRSLEVSGLQVDWTTMSKRSDKMKITEYWEINIESQESFLEFKDDCKYRIFTHIKNNFLIPRENNTLEDAKYSMLLYGPPGTGKTTVAEKIAESLQWKLITITPSDFLAGGAGEVEARAKAIFRCLNEQKKAVILFDEIDHFLLDRESKEYENQQGIFQFMTPGMLPKIKNLRDNKRSIFIIATNFEERIDPAIKRKGRIDTTYALMPPAFKQRYLIIRNFFYQNDDRIYKDVTEKKIHEFALYCAALTALRTFTDLKEFKDLLKVVTKDSDLDKLMKDEKMPSASISTKAYFARFYEPIKQNDTTKTIKTSQTPLIEFYLATLIKLQKPIISDIFSLKTIPSLTHDEHHILYESKDELISKFKRERLLYEELIQKHPTPSTEPTKTTSP